MITNHLFYITPLCFLFTPQLLALDVNFKTIESVEVDDNRISEFTYYGVLQERKYSEIPDVSFLSQIRKDFREVKELHHSVTAKFDTADEDSVLYIIRVTPDSDQYTILQRKEINRAAASIDIEVYLSIVFIALRIELPLKTLSIKPETVNNILANGYISLENAGEDTYSRGTLQQASFQHGHLTAQFRCWMVEPGTHRCNLVFSEDDSANTAWKKSLDIFTILNISENQVMYGTGSLGKLEALTVNYKIEKVR